MRSMMKIRRSAAQPKGGVRSNTGSLLGVLALGLLALGGCGDLQPIATFEPETDATKLFGSLTLDHRAINLSTEAPYDTIRLTATPRNLQGAPLAGLPEPTFRSSDTVAVWVTPDGLVQARQATSGVWVIAEVTTGDNVRHADTAYVKVTSSPTPPELVSFSITADAPEQVQLPMTPTAMGTAFFLFDALGRTDATPVVQVQALSEGDVPIAGLEIDFQSLDPKNVKIDRRTGLVQRVAGPPGEVAIVARTAAYGVVKADTATFTVTPPLYQDLIIQRGPDGAPRLSIDGVTIRAGGYVFWQNTTMGTTLGITFDEPAGAEADPEFCAAFGGFLPHLCASGDITDLVGGDIWLESFRVRRFPEPGVYEYQVMEGGTKGRIRVVSHDDPLSVNEENEE